MTLLKREINKYFKSCFEEILQSETRIDKETGYNIKDETGEQKRFVFKMTVSRKEPTISGLDLALINFGNIKETPEYRNAILKIKDYYEQLMVNRGYEGLQSLIEKI